MYNIRKFKSDDAAEVSKLICRSLTLVNSKDYSEENIRFMTEHFSAQTVAELAEKRYMLVALEDAKIVGTGSLCNDHVYTLFVDPDQQGKGIGKALMRELEALAVNKGIAVLRVPSSLTALRFYEHLKKKKNFRQSPD